ncbi:MAG: DinB family protein [Cytophagales bacterium]
MEISNLIDQLELSFYGKPEWKGHAWHGPSVINTIGAVKEEQAQNRFGDSHSIIELVEHMTAWRTFVTQRLLGNKEYKVSKEQNFPLDGSWKKSTLLLVESQQQLVAALRLFPEERLSETVDGMGYSYRVMINGIIHHDLYHTGQIVLLKKGRAD